MLLWVVRVYCSSLCLLSALPKRCCARFHPFLGPSCLFAPIRQSDWWQFFCRQRTSHINVVAVPLSERAQKKCKGRKIGLISWCRFYLARFSIEITGCELDLIHIYIFHITELSIIIEFSVLRYRQKERKRGSRLFGASYIFLFVCNGWLTLPYSVEMEKRKGERETERACVKYDVNKFLFKCRQIRNWKINLC